MTDTTSIPLSKLTAWDGNVRKTAGAVGRLDRRHRAIAWNLSSARLIVLEARRDLPSQSATSVHP